MSLAAITVLVFLGTECPISNRAIPELNALAGDYPAAKFRAVYFEPNATQHAKEYGLGFGIIYDPKLSLAAKYHAAVTPTAIVTDAKDVVLYRGAIAPLRSALKSIAEGRAVAVKESRALGCALPFDKAPAPNAPTWDQVAPLIHRECTGCHRTGGAAPFPLESFQDAKTKAPVIAYVVRNRIMPPWLPAKQPHAFIGERRLAESEIRLIEQWASAPVEPKQDGPNPAPAPKTDSPDAVLNMPRPFEIPAGGKDQYRCIVIPNALQEDHWLRGFEFKPGNRRVVHHALIFSDTSGTARKRAAEDPSGTYACFGVPGFLPTSTLGGWTPGAGAQFYYPGTAVRIRKGADVVVQLHYQPSGKPETDRSSIALYYSATPPTITQLEIPLGSRQIDIAPHQPRFVVRDHFTLPVDTLVTGIIPHAHYIAKTMRGAAVLPNGTRQQLIYIPRWDFNWQQQYRYAQPFTLPAGTQLEMEFVYDNSANDKRVQWGPDSTDEMAGLHVQVIPADPKDAQELSQQIWGKLMREVGGRFYSKPAPQR